MWNTLPLKINPILYDFGWITLRWYSLGYFLALLTILLLVFWRLKRNEIIYFKKQVHLNDRLFSILFFSFLGMFFGAKLGYIFLYDWQNFFLDPWQNLNPFSEGKFVGFFGLSFHGGLIGVLLGSLYACKKEKLSWLKLIDLITPIFPLAYFWGRIGNFFNGELFGRITLAPWGMYFPIDPQNLRHPSQLYEAIGEGILIFLILWPIRNKPRFQGKFLFIFLFFYGLIRFSLEFFRQEPFFLFNFLTKGQFLCLIMILIGWLGYKIQTSYQKLK